MRRLLTLATVAAALAAGSVGIAAASGSRGASGGHGSAHGAATADPVRLPHGVPSAASGQPGAYAFTPVARIAASLAPARPARASSHSAAPSGASASVTVTATVLPVALVVVDRSGAVRSVTINTPDRDGRHLLFAVRRGSVDGVPVAITAATWPVVSRALRATGSGLGTVWSS